MSASSTSTLWDRALVSLREKVDEESYQTWLKSIEFIGVSDAQVNLSVPTTFCRNWVMNNFQETIEDSLSELLHREIKLNVQLSADPAAEESSPQSDAAPMDVGAYQRAHDEANAAQLSQTEKQAMEEFRRHRAAVNQPSEIISVPLNRNYSFDNFVVGESNRFAHAAAQAVAEPGSKVYNPLFIYGGVGLGKTHLMQAIGQRLQSYGRHFNVLYVSSEAFMNAFIESVAQKNLSEFRNCFRNVDLLLVDDIQFFAGAEQTQTEFFHTFNVLYDAGKKIVLSSDSPPKELHALEERLRSRFEWGLIVDIQPPDLETRVAILRNKARSMGLDMPDEVTIYIAERIRRNLRKLEGSLTRLAANSTLSKEPITVEMARRMLGPFMQGEEPKRITVEMVQLAICERFQVTLHELTGPNRSRKFSKPRQYAAYLSRELTDASFPDIAHRFGGRDHTSIMHACKKVQQDINTDMSLGNLIKELKRVIKNESGGNGQ